MSAQVSIDKQFAHVGVRFYRVEGVELTLVPPLRETARSAGNGYFLRTIAQDLREEEDFDS